MTRTERNTYPAALLKDRHSRTGMHKASEITRKNGAGAHNWGSLNQEGELEQQADADVALESADLFEENNINVAGIDTKVVNDQDANKIISTSPTDSMSSLDSASEASAPAFGAPATQARPVPAPRRMSNVTDEERERARVYREGALNKGDVDLAHIARTSYGIAQSPPNAFTISTSPQARKASFSKH